MTYIANGRRIFAQLLRYFYVKYSISLTWIPLRNFETTLVLVGKRSCDIAITCRLSKPKYVNEFQAQLTICAPTLVAHVFFARILRLNIFSWALVGRVQESSKDKQWDRRSMIWFLQTMGFPVFRSVQHNKSKEMKQVHRRTLATINRCDSILINQSSLWRQQV